MKIQVCSNTMSIEAFCIKFMGNNYSISEFQLKMFLIGKEIWGHNDGSLKTLEDANDLSAWEMNDVLIIF